MYVGVDIGGTKTFVATLNNSGVIIKKERFATPNLYEDFLIALEKAANDLGASDFKAGCVAVPGRVDRDRGVALYLGNLPWKNVPIQTDAERIFKCPIILENDSRLGGLSEAMLLPANKRILYVTISTGIGIGFIVNRTIVPELADSEAGRMLLEYHGKRVRWESFASGKAIVKRFGKKAVDINDEATWRRIAHDLAQGFIELLAIMQPDIVVVGGSVGQYFDRFKDFLVAELSQNHDPLVPIPIFQKAQRPGDAVLYGCYDLARVHYG